MADAALEAARRSVTLASEEILKNSASAPLNEALGSKDWARLRREWLNAADAAGVDFRAALLYDGNIPEATPYDPANVLLDTAAGALAPSMVHVRQRALLAWIRRELPDASESAKLVRDCVHAGGYLGPATGPNGPMQALRLLD